MLIPGPIVGLIETFLINSPFTPLGLSLFIESTKNLIFVTKSSFEKFDLAMPA